MFVGLICSVSTTIIDGVKELKVRMFGRHRRTDKPRYENFLLLGSSAERRLAELGDVDNTRYCYAFDNTIVNGFERHPWDTILNDWHIDYPFLVEIKNGKAKVYL